MNPPSFVPEYNTAAKALLAHGEVSEPSFSRGTYQVEVNDKGVPFYPFLQITDQGDLSDSLCSCELSESGHGCPHLAAAWLRIFHGTSEPLHVRFQKSFWHALFRMAAKRLGYETCLLHQNEEEYVAFSKTRKKLFAVGASAEAKQKLNQLISERAEVTEETSL